MATKKRAKKNLLTKKMKNVTERKTNHDHHPIPNSFKNCHSAGAEVQFIFAEAHAERIHNRVPA